MEAAWQQAACEQGELKMVGGAAGAGKSKLCAELTTLVEAQVCTI